MRVFVKVLARACKEKVVANPDGTLKVYLKEAPTDGRANRSLIVVLAEFFDVRKSQVSIVAGMTSRKKIVEIKK